jgi:hypothetical protein
VRRRPVDVRRRSRYGISKLSVRGFQGQLEAIQGRGERGLACVLEGGHRSPCSDSLGHGVDGRVRGTILSSAAYARAGAVRYGSQTAKYMIRQ